MLFVLFREEYFDLEKMDHGLEMIFENVEFIEADITVDDEAGPSGVAGRGKTQTQKGKRKKRTEYFSSSDKKRLAAEVKVRPVIWDISNCNHYNTNAINLAWNQIGSVLNRVTSECKTAWIALRESHRYHLRVLKEKSGSSGGTPIPEPSCRETLEWEFAEDLAFMPDTTKKRKTFTTDPKEPEVVQERNDEPLDESFSSTSNYNYQSRPTERTTKSQEDETVTQLAENINLLIEHQRALQPPTPSTTESSLVHHIALANFDRMLQQLPPTVVEDACFEITVLLYEKIKQQQARE